MGGRLTYCLVTYFFGYNLRVRCALGKLRLESGIQGISVSSILNPMVLSGKVTFKERPEGDVGGNLADF